MAFRIKSQGSIKENIVRIVSEEMATTVEQLRHRSPKERDEAIHEARKSLKKIRGILKLVRPEIGSTTYRKENARLQETGRNLSQLRDAGAIIDTFDHVIATYHQQPAGNDLLAIRTSLVNAKHENERRLQVAREMSNSSRQIVSFTQRVSEWRFANDGFQAISSGLKRSYRDGRRAMRQAIKTERPDDFHEWRKRAKDHWYHVRLLENLWPEAMQGREKSIHDLESSLGEDHNLFVLCEQIKADPGSYGGQETVSRFVSMAEKESEELQSQARALGLRVYEEKPRKFIQSLEQLWNAWSLEAELIVESEKGTQRKRATTKTARKHVA